jgi:GNAT superfamily N-acetyltransferase
MSPWDSSVLGMDAWEISILSRQAIEIATKTPGHYTVRVNPLASKELLHENGFYYCDTLIEPYCPANRFSGFAHNSVTISQETTLEQLLAICHGAFSYGRFHRDFNLQCAQADIRYDNWLSKLYGADKVHGLLYCGELAGFIAVEKNCLALHAVAESLRGQGLAKYLWTPVCEALFKQGFNELFSSISTANLAVLNLYVSLGFRFRNPVDLYHRLTK